MNDHGGVVFHFDGFIVFNTLGGEWTVQKEGRPLSRHKDITQAFWKGMDWPEKVEPEQFKHLIDEEAVR
jgi:hypothetical protein